MPTRILSQVLPKARHQHPRWRVFLLQNKMKLFITAFLQVFFVSANTYFLATVNYVGAMVCGFMISWLWSSNVRKVAIGGTRDRFIYALGACLGGLAGLFISQLV